MSRLRALAVIALLVGGACGGPGTPSREDVIEDLTTSLIVVSDDALDPRRAACVAEALVDGIGLESLDQVIAAASADEPAAGEVRDQVIAIFTECGALDAVLPGVEPAQ